MAGFGCVRLTIEEVASLPERLVNLIDLLSTHFEAKILQKI